MPQGEATRSSGLAVGPYRSQLGAGTPLRRVRSRSCSVVGKEKDKDGRTLAACCRHSQHTGRCPHLHCHRGPAPACPSPERWPIASHSCLRAGVGKSRPTFVKHRALISLLSPRPHQARTRAPLRMARSVPHAAFAARRPPLNTAWPCHPAPHTVGCKARPQPCPVE